MLPKLELRQTTAVNNLPSGAAISRDRAKQEPTIDNSLNKILNLKPKMKSSNLLDVQDRSVQVGIMSNYAKTKICEDELFAAATHFKLAQSDNALADKFIRKMGLTLDKMQSNHGSVNLYKASERVLRQLIRDGAITQSQYQETKAFALGKAQLDQNRTEVAGTKFKDSPLNLPFGNKTATSSTDLQTAMQKFNSNSPASELEVQILELKNAFNSLMLALARSQFDRSEHGDPKHGPMQHEVIKNSSPQMNSSSHSSAQSIAAPSGFLWKPISDSDGKLAILLPPSLTSKAVGCRILSPDGTKVLASGRDGGVGNGDRQHYRFNQSGAAFPVGSIVEVNMRDGSTMKIKIENPSVRLEGR